MQTIFNKNLKKDYASDELRGVILNNVEKFVKEKNSVPQQQITVPVSGKVIDEHEIKNAIDACLDMWLTTGRYNNKFEKKMSEYLNVKYFLTCNSGSSANLLALSALCSHQLKEKRIKKGDEVITCAMGFPTTVNPIIQNGLTPVFVDASLSNYNIDENKIEKAITKKTKAIMIAHTLGNPFNLKKIMAIKEKYNLYLIEDCCDALGAEYEGKKVGTFGDISTLSFYPAHHITMGEGGAVFSNNSRLKKIIESIRDWGRDCWCETGCDNTCKKRFGWKLGDLPHGYDHKYIYSNLGYNLKITDMQAAIGFAQLSKLESFIKKRNENFKLLLEVFKHFEDFFVLPKATKSAKPSWFGFPLSIKNNLDINRNHLLEYLNNKNIGTRLMFAGNILRQPYMKNLKFKTSGTFANSDFIMNNSFWLGNFPGIGKEHINYVGKTIDSYINKFAR